MSYMQLRRNSITTLLLILVLLVPLGQPLNSLAQEPTNEPTVGSETPPEPQPTDLQLVDLDATATATPSPEQTVTPTDIPPDPAPSIEATADPTAIPDTITELPPEEFENPEQVQGPVKLDVTVAPASIKAGGTVTYTYIMTNTTSSAVNPKVRLRWVDFNETDRSGIVQYCAVAACPSESVQGSATVSAAEKISVNGQTVYQYTITGLAAGQSARFSVRLRTRPDRYPQSGREPVRPSGSGELFLNDNFSSPVSQDTANSLIVGPVFVVTKAVTNTPAKVYPLETVEFTINVGNATATGDVINGRIRADAINATNVTLVDTIPNGSSFVSAEGNPVVDTQRKTLTWTIPQIARGQSASFKVRFKKENVASDCGRITNSSYYATSPEMPLRIASETYRITGASLSHPVVTPIEVQNITSDPPSTVFGTDARLTIRVRNYFNQAVNGVKLTYAIQSNASYVPNTATPAPSLTPGQGLGGTLEWTFNMAAGNTNIPTVAEFSFTVRGGYTTQVAGGSGVASITAPASIPSACTKSLNGRAGLIPRIIVSQVEFIEPINGENIVEQGSEIPLVITVKNEGVETAPNVNIFEVLPSNGGANFSYVQGSSTVNGTAQEPTQVDNGSGGLIEWQGVNIPAGETAEVAFKIRVEGNEFSRYCLNASAAVNNTPDETITKRNTQVCVKINPNFELTKTADRSVINSTPAAPGGEVVFTLRLTNRSGQTYEVGLYDVPGSFTFVRQESGYDTPSLNNSGHLEWPRRSLAPNNTLEAVVRMRLPNECVTKEYVNEARFTFVANDGSVYGVVTIPKTEAKVKHNCGTNKIEYQVSVDRETISLKDTVKYAVTVKNLNTTAEIRDIDVTSILPEGFKFEAMTTDSQLRTNPQSTTRPDGRVRLTWRIPQLAANATYRINFTGRSGDIVGNFENWIRATAPNLQEAVCRGLCTAPFSDQGETVTYSRGVTTVKPLHTALPEMTNVDQCAEPEEERSYTLSLVNTNSHAYASTAVTVTLPLGLHFKNTLGTAPSQITYERDGRTTLVWRGLNVPAKPANASSALLKLQVQVIAGRVFGDLETTATVTSPDGAIPRQDGVDNPKVKMCADEAAMAKDASKRTVDPNEEFIYQIMAVNPGTSAISLNIEDTLPSQLTFVGNVSGAAPTRNGNQLSWANVNVPAASNGVPGIAALRFRVKLTGGNAGDKVRNTATVSGGAQINTEFSNIEIEIRRRSNIHLPMVRR